MHITENTLKTLLFELDAAEKLDYGMWSTRTAIQHKNAMCEKWFSITLCDWKIVYRYIAFSLIHTGMFFVFFTFRKFFTCASDTQTQHNEYLFSIYLGVVPRYIVMDGCWSPWKSGKKKQIDIKGHARKFIWNWSALLAIIMCSITGGWNGLY